MTNYNQMRMPSYEYPQAYLLPALNSYECINPKTVLPFKETVLNIEKELEKWAITHGDGELYI